MSADFGLTAIAKHFDKQDAVVVFAEAMAAEEAGEFDGSISLYKRAFKMWDALDSGVDDGLPRAVRRVAEAAGLDCEALARQSMEAQPSQRFAIADVEQWLSYLDEHGYCVIAEAADAGAVAEAKSLLWDFLESIPESTVRGTDFSTWGNSDWLPSSRNGVIGSHGIGQSAFCWHARMLPAVKQAFSAIWGCDDLLVSFDSGNVFRPWAQRPDWRTEGSWWHIDQNFFNPGKSRRVTVQGLVTFTDATSATGGLCVIPGSHKQHKDVCERSHSQNFPGDFVQVQPGDPIFESHARLVCARAGDLVLFDSRCVHCNTPGILERELASSHSDGLVQGVANWTPTTCEASARVPVDVDADLIRVAAYVCMTPASWASDDVLAQRKDASINNVTLDHWPHEFHGPCVVPPWPPANSWSDVPEPRKRMIVGATSPLLT